MPITSRKYQFIKALFESNRELRINKKILIKHLNLLLQTPWFSDHSALDLENLHPESLSDGVINRLGAGFIHVNGETVRIQLSKIVLISFA